MRTLLATLLLVATTGAASAYCVSVPDDQSTGYVRNNLKKTICLNNELAQDTAQKNWEVKVDTALSQLDRAFVADKLEAIKPVQVPGVNSTWP